MESTNLDLHENTETPVKKRGRKPKPKIDSDLILLDKRRRSKRINYASLNGENSEDEEGKDKEDAKNSSNNELESKTLNVESDINNYHTAETPPIKKKRGRKRKNEDRNNENAFVNSSSTIEQPKTAQKKRTGRPPKSKTAKPSATNTKITNITCAVCDEELTASAWIGHKLKKHNNLAWKVGEPPLDLSDQQFVMSTLAILYKRRIPLHCEKCGVKKKSVIGFMSHQAQCMKSFSELSDVRVQCQYCDSNILPVSMQTHLRLSHKDKYERVYKKNLTPSAPEATTPTAPDGSKRKAAMKAIEIIQRLSQKGELEDESDSSKWNSRRLFSSNYNFLFSKRMQTKFMKISKEKGSINCVFECDFQSSDLHTFLDHVSLCEKKPSWGFICKFCVIAFETKEQAIQHGLTNHHSKPAEDGTDDGEDESENQENSVTKSSRAFSAEHRLHFINIERISSCGRKGLYRAATKWTRQFQKENYSESELFPCWRLKPLDLSNINPSAVLKFLPEEKQSIEIAKVNTEQPVDVNSIDYEFKSYFLFESDCFDDDNSIFFCGGPISAMAWMPTPYIIDQNPPYNQILALSTDDFRSKINLNNLYSGPNLLQFWNVGYMICKDNKRWKPRLEFCIAHNYGVVNHMEWCPSGSYDITTREHYLKRFGIIAIACTNSFVYLYSVSFPENRTSIVCEQKPVLKLQLEVEDGKVGILENQPTRLSWTKLKGHENIAVGYSNGAVGIFQLNTNSSLLNLGTDLEGVQTILPFRLFLPHSHCITALHLLPLNNGRRFLMSASADRFIKFWDLENLGAPISSNYRANITSGAALTNWVNAVLCQDGHIGAIMAQPRDFGTNPTIYLPSKDCAGAITGSDWLNAYMQGNSSGELTLGYSHQLFNALRSDKYWRQNTFTFSYAGVVQKHLTKEARLEHEIREKLMRDKRREFELDDAFANDQEIPCEYRESLHLDYKEAYDKYALVFHDLKTKWMRTPKELVSLTTSPTETKFSIYPMQNVTQVQFNPNEQSNVGLAVGYQAGFVRIMNLNFLLTKPS